MHGGSGWKDVFGSSSREARIRRIRSQWLTPYKIRKNAQNSRSQHHKIAIPWCSGYHICVTRRRIPVRCRLESYCFKINLWILYSKAFLEDRVGVKKTNKLSQESRSNDFALTGLGLYTVLNNQICLIPWIPPVRSQVEKRNFWKDIPQNLNWQFWTWNRQNNEKG